MVSTPSWTSTLIWSLLKPGSEARTITLGAVFTPPPIPDLVISFDYYRTKMKNAITFISYQNDAIQNLCLSSAPTYDSPFCSLAIRPISDPNDPRYRDPNFNFPTEVLNSPFNTAEQKTEGYELQVSYGLDASALVAGRPDADRGPPQSAWRQPARRPER